MSSNNKKQQVKKIAVFSGMFLVFIASMWMIFAPSEADKEKQQQGMGFNADIPDPKKDEIIGDKRDAYEQEQVRQKQKERMRSLDSFMADGEYGQSAGIPHQEEPITEKPAKMEPAPQNPIRSSNTAYQDINRTLGNFYEKPKDDPEKLELKKKLEQLEVKLDEQENRKNTMDEQLLLMEKSYQLAAKYMPQNQNYGEEAPFGQRQGLSAEQMKNKIVKSSGSKKTMIRPVRQVRESTVTALVQRPDDEELMDQYDRERNYGFHTMEKSELNSNKNTISATVHEEQTLADGQSCRLRLSEPLIAGSTFIPENTLITGNAKVQGERLEISVSSIEYEGEIIAVELTVYDSDGQRGINIPGSMELTAAKEIAANMGSNLGSTINISQQSAGQQLLTDMGRGIIQGTSQYLGKKFRPVKVTLNAAYKLMLLPKEN